MSNALARWCVPAVAGCLLLAQLSMAAEGINGNLVDVHWLEKNLNNSGVLILDTSAAQAYAEKHIPGAISVDVMMYGLPEQPAAHLEKMYRSWGISPGKQIVFYDQGGGMGATRIFFSLYSSGFPVKDLLILDGGLTKWQQEGLPVTKDATPAPKQGSFTIVKVDEDPAAELPEFLAASGDPVNNAFVDALGPDWHFGEVHPFDRAGHIPRGILLPSADFYNQDKTFKSAEEIRKMLAYVGIRPEQRIYTYCGGGVAASVPFFALKFILNYPKVKMYVASELGWLRDERGLPYWTYDAPFLVREANWLQFWGGQMARMVGGRVSVVDVRAADAFTQGHVPLALNIPVDVFRSNLASPGKLAEVLGLAGLDASHEAVVISGAGLAKDSALAFVMLEKLGQKRVSVLMGSMDDWTQQGFQIAKAAAVRPGTYSGNVRTDVIITDPRSTQGIYPKVFIASGKDVPAKTQDGKVVHVPYTELLNPDGTPKAAKDIWNILSKAGVPRYAELVCYSDDPGEAAANYYILKLMGYPDIKVLLI